MEKPVSGLKNRYPGGRPFAEDDIQLFFGRQRDVKELTTLIEAKQTVVLLSKSGYGKSSLINAGVIPFFKELENVACFSIKLSNYSQKEGGAEFSPLNTVIARLREQVSLDESSAFNRLNPQERSLWYWVKQNQLARRSVPNLRIVIFFEQFEALFTYSKKDINDFSEQLSELLNSTMPKRYKEIIEDPDHGDLEQDLYDFLMEKPDIRIVFAIRADRLSQMTMLSLRNPSILQHCYELEALSRNDARAAITEPAKIGGLDVFKSPAFTYEDRALEKILDGIANEQDNTIEAATLQIICRHIEDNIVTVDHTYVTIRDLGDITNIFQQYYEGVLNKLPVGERETAENFLEQEMIDGELRNALSEEYIRRKFTVSQNLLNVLEASSLLKKERGVSGRFIYEIGHDTIALAVSRVALEKRLRIVEERRRLLEQEVRDQEAARLFAVQEESERRAGQLRTKQKAIRIWRFLVFTLVTLSLVVVLVFDRWHRSVTVIDDLKAYKGKLIDSLTQERKSNTLIEARRYVGYGDDYLKLGATDAYENAMDSYRSALDLLKDFSNDPLFNEVQHKIGQLKATQKMNQHSKNQ